MKCKYSKPMTDVCKSHLRMSILAGSGDTGAFNGVTGGSSTGKDFEFGARQRKSIKFEY